MKITDSRRVAAPTSAAKPARSRVVTPVGEPAETVSVAGIPKSELTPRVMQALTQLMEEVASLRSELSRTKAKVDELSTLAFTDPLTGVFNRRAFVAELNRTLAVVERHGQPAAIAYFDLDDMKAVNDGFGHAGGDAAIRHVATTLKEHVRQTDIVGRLGGDEFGVIFAYSDDEASAGKVRELQMRIADADIPLGDRSFRITVTAGVAPIKGGQSVEATLDLADAAMYAGKASKKKVAS